MGIKFSVDGGVTFQDAPEGVRIVVDGLVFAGEDEPGELHMNVTTEGVIRDAWVSREEALDHNIGTGSQSFEEIALELVEDAA